MTLAFIGMLVVMFVQVAARYVFAVGVPWTDETSRFLFIGEIFLGAAIAQRAGAQIRITILLDMLPRSARRVFDVIGDLLTVAIAGALVWGAVGMMQRTGSVSASTIPVSFSTLYLIQAIGIAMLVLLVLRDLVLTLFGRSTPESAA
ncbi:TRAP transporter small permease subunit [Jiella sp. 40Bstr34]|uniref:TRAP transporter small permease protein n=2 Tax=Jiella pacifica TaxID=2696469 RepID=A0A6N9SZA3_9HYPH|nr:TRAP transporter small permease subunit [Jiella pacifica]